MPLADAACAALVAGAPDAILVGDAAGRVVDANPAAEALLGYARHELLGTRVADLVAAGSGQAGGEYARHLAAGGWRGELGLRRKDGSVVPVEASAVAVPDPGGPLYASFLRDVTERKAAEAALRAGEARFRAAFRDAAVGMALVAPDGRFLAANPAFCALLGYGEAELLARTFRDVTHPDDLAAGIEAVRRTAAGELPGFRAEKRYCRKDGGTVWAELNVSAVRGENGAVVQLVAQLQDVTERKAVEQALRASEARLNEAQAIARVGSWEAGVADDTMLWSDEMRRLHGLAPGEAVTLDRFLAAVHPDDRARVAGVRRESGLPLEHTTTVYRVVHPDGDVRVLESHGEAEYGDRGEPVRIVGTTQDVTERARWEAQLVAARDAAEEASRLKSAFLRTMSHELRTPLTAVLGYAELLRGGFSGPLAPAQEGDVAQIAAAAAHLLALVDDVLDLSRLQADGVELDRARVDLAAAAAEVVAGLAPQAAAKGIALAADVPEGLAVAADPRRLRQVLLNLAGNAVKFTEAGEVRIAARAAGGTVEISVADTGIGIPPAFLPHLFDDFRQADERTTRRYGGSGLGLPITKRLVEAHGGAIRVESAPGVGSTFTVSLPGA